MVTRTQQPSPQTAPLPPSAPAAAQIVAEIPAGNALLGGRWHQLPQPFLAERRALVAAPRRPRTSLAARFALAAEDALSDVWGSFVERREVASNVTEAWAAWLN